MRLASFLRYLYLSRFSKPVADRVLYRTIRSQGVKKILEIGIGQANRSLRMLELARSHAGSEPIRYAAIDLFEARAAAAGRMSLKDAHKFFKPSQAQVQLIPGDPTSALSRVANSLANQDLVIVSSLHDAESLAGAWFYLPRMLHGQSMVFLEAAEPTSGQMMFRPLELGEIQARAAAARRRRAA